MANGELILIAEDDYALREGMQMLLESEGYKVIAASDGDETICLYNSHHPDLILLDIGMPNKNGFDVCKEIRASDLSIPIIFLTARNKEEDELRGMLLGADDFIIKAEDVKSGTSNAVTLAHIAAVLARSKRSSSTNVPGFNFAGWYVNVSERCLEAVHRRRTTLIDREIQMLKIFSQHPGEVISRDFLFRRVWGTEFNGDEANLTIAISRLREKLGQDGRKIVTIYREGYRFDEIG